MKKELLGGGPLQFKEKELHKALKVFGWSFASLLVVLGIDLISALEVQGVGWVPIANTVLYALKEFIADNR